MKFLLDLYHDVDATNKTCIYGLNMGTGSIVCELFGSTLMDYEYFLDNHNSNRDDHIRLVDPLCHLVVIKPEIVENYKTIRIHSQVRWNKDSPVTKAFIMKSSEEVIRHLCVMLEVEDDSEAISFLLAYRDGKRLISYPTDEEIAEAEKFDDLLD